MNRVCFLILLSVAVATVLWPVRADAQNASSNQAGMKKMHVNGVELSYRDFGQGEPIIFVHGALDDQRMWDEQLGPFSKSYRVIAYSRRYNYPNDNSAISPDHSALVDAEDLAKLLKKLKLRRVHIVGHSYGAYAALFVAVKYPNLVRSLVLSEPPAFSLISNEPAGKMLVDNFLKTLWTPLGEAFKKNDDQAALRMTVRYFAGADVLDDVPQSVRDYWLSNIREWRALALSTSTFPVLDRSKVRKISVPVLLLNGGKSLKELKAVSSELEGLLANVKSVTFTDATHDMWTEQPAQLTKAVTDFLSKTNAR